ARTAQSLPPAAAKYVVSDEPWTPEASGGEGDAAGEASARVQPEDLSTSATRESTAVVSASSPLPGGGNPAERREGGGDASSSSSAPAEQQGEEVTSSASADSDTSEASSSNSEPAPFVCYHHVFLLSHVLVVPLIVPRCPLNHGHSSRLKPLMSSGDVIKTRREGDGGKILQRFPSRDWPDCPFIFDGIELVGVRSAQVDLPSVQDPRVHSPPSFPPQLCQPLGWTLSPERLPPKFIEDDFWGVSRDRRLQRFLLSTAPLTSLESSSPPRRETNPFLPSYQPLASSPLRRQNSAGNTGQMYAPKCLVLISSHHYCPDTLRNCLATIYSCFLENPSVPLEVLVGNLLCIRIPPPGGPQVRREGDGGKILQRFPSRDWPDCPFIFDGIELVGVRSAQVYLPPVQDPRVHSPPSFPLQLCQPLGWTLSPERLPPKFIVSVHSYVDAQRHLCAFLSFYEPVVIEEPSVIDEEDDFWGVSRDRRLQRFLLSTAPLTSLESSSPPRRETNPFLPSYQPLASSPLRRQNSAGNTGQMYAPKCLVLISSHHYCPDTLRNCLATIYSCFLENPSVPLEVLVGNLLCIRIPPPGGPQVSELSPRGTELLLDQLGQYYEEAFQGLGKVSTFKRNRFTVVFRQQGTQFMTPPVLKVRFRIGSDDKQAIQPPLHPWVPNTGTVVADLIRQVGIVGLVRLLCGVLTQHKILFQSSSFNRLTNASRALVALMYPLKYGPQVYIPVFPSRALEILESPVPFLGGIHSSLRGEIDDRIIMQSDLILADLDGGYVSCPDDLPAFPEPLTSKIQTNLSMVLSPGLLSADDAFPPAVGQNTRLQTPEMLDKEIRAICMRTIALLLQGYRNCLTVVRVHPKPLIKFNKVSLSGLSCGLIH
ncbi:unnamed protein product, partial [Cyprideis torosa]